MTTNRYPDIELEEFRQLINSKLERAREQLDLLQEQIFEITENSEDEFGSDWMDDSSINDNMEMLNDMAIRQRKYIRDLENALLRIRNKTYGICVISGELIDKRRLLAVPTTTKSLQAKQAAAAPPPRPAPVMEESEEEESEKKSASSVPQPRKVITRVIRKTPATPKYPTLPEEEEEVGFSDPDLEDEDRPPTISLDDDDLDLDDLGLEYGEEEEY